MACYRDSFTFSFTPHRDLFPTSHLLSQHSQYRPTKSSRAISARVHIFTISFNIKTFLQFAQTVYLCSPMILTMKSNYFPKQNWPAGLCNGEAGTKLLHCLHEIRLRRVNAPRDLSFEWPKTARPAAVGSSSVALWVSGPHTVTCLPPRVAERDVLFTGQLLLLYAVTL
jgi:hypothetical protein